MMRLSEKEETQKAVSRPLFLAAGETGPGLLRRKNEDSFCLVRSRCGRKLFAVVADGIGGNGRGEIASFICCSQLAGAFLDEETRLDTAEAAADFLGRTLKSVNRHIWQRNYIGRYRRPMGTTVNCCVFLPDGLVMANAGDSRLYECRPGADVRIISSDHSFENIRCTLGIGGHCVVPDNAIYRAAGVRRNIEFELAAFPRVPGAKYLLCSDGMYRTLTCDRIQAALRRAETPRSALNEFMRASLIGGGADNITGIVVFVSGEKS
ncbi:MAG: serine/threonine-protein phosphatase [Lentisphaeria bacterium]|nr:serine/threonine-protein phosphatase [Lentisphaeria bacterium]